MTSFHQKLLSRYATHRKEATPAQIEQAMERPAIITHEAELTALIATYGIPINVLYEILLTTNNSFDGEKKKKLVKGLNDFIERGMNINEDRRPMLRYLQAEHVTDKGKLKVGELIAFYHKQQPRID